MSILTRPKDLNVNKIASDHIQSRIYHKIIIKHKNTPSTYTPQTISLPKKKKQINNINTNVVALP